MSSSRIGLEAAADLYDALINGIVGVRHLFNKLTAAPSCWWNSVSVTLLRQKRPNNFSRFVDREHAIQMPAIAFNHEHIRCLAEATQFRCGFL
jgi:hypothetical protein